MEESSQGPFESQFPILKDQLKGSIHPFSQLVSILPCPASLETLCILSPPQEPEVELASRHMGLVLVAFLAMVLELEPDLEVSFPISFSPTSGKLGEEKWVK